MGNQKAKKVLWAIDVFEESGELERHYVNALNALARSVPMKIEPVYIVSPEQLNLELELSAVSLEVYRPAAQKALSAMASKVTGAEILPATVLVHTKPSQRSSVKKLVSYAESTNAEMIIVGSHAREGLSRMMLGSFSEGLLLESEIPVLVISPSSSVGGQIGRLLFPTDFSETSIPAFQKLLRLTAGLGEKVTVLHAIPSPIEPVVQSGVYLMTGGWVPVPDFLQKREEAQRDLGKKWIDIARENGVTAELVIDADSSSITGSILRYAEESKVDMIVMAAESGPLAAAILGSITRKVIRAAKCPVLVVKSGKRD